MPSYALLRPTRTLRGDPMPAVVAEKPTLEAARALVPRSLDCWPHVWIEEWTDGRTTVKAKIVERWHRRTKTPAEVRS